jgi:hypothetical protein
MGRLVFVTSRLANIPMSFILSAASTLTVIKITTARTNNIIFGIFKDFTLFPHIFMPFVKE